MTVMPLSYVEAPPSGPPQFGLLSAAVVVEDNDPHGGRGFEYTPDFCTPARTTLAACLKAAAGTLSVSVGTTRNATATFGSVPAAAYPLQVYWGDGSSSTVSSGTTSTHSYTANGSYSITVLGNADYTASATATVTNGSATGPFTGSPTASPAKTIDDGAPSAVGDAFAVYALRSCKLVGNAVASERAARSLVLGEDRAVESWFSTLMKSKVSDLGLTGLKITEAVAALENYIHCNYGGVGTIHMTRAAASMLTNGNMLVQTPVGLSTKLGNRVSAGCYPDAFASQGNDPFASQSVWATGTVMLRRGPVFTPPDPVVDTTNNIQYALAERTYSGSYECFAVGISGIVPK